MGHGRHITGGSAEVAPAPITEYNVTGPIWPDARCNYFVAGTHNEKPYYRRADGFWFIWWNSDPAWWYLTNELGIITYPYWRREDPSIIGDYITSGGYGVATVSAGLHEPIIADYHVTGDITPDAKGNYKVAGDINGYPYYDRVAGGFSLWHQAENWWITIGPGEYEPEQESCWYHTGGIEGEYLPEGFYTGIATVTAGPA